MSTQHFETNTAPESSRRKTRAPQPKATRRFSFAGLCGLFMLCASCGGGGTQLGGEDLTNLQFHLYSTDMGVYPSTTVLKDPNNPFARVSTDALNNGTPAKPALKWTIGQSGTPIVAFYAWASTLANAPNGENQFYTATDLHSIYTDQLCAAADLEAVRTMAIAAYTAQLTYFPTDYARNADGTLSFDFATASLQAIVALGGTAPQGWVLTTGVDGNPHAVRL